MKYLLLICIIPVCLGLDFNCLKGPSYWCKNFDNAQKCKKITECYLEKASQVNKDQKSVKRVSVQGKNEITCELCLQAVKFIDERFRGFTEQEFIASVNSIICDRLEGDLSSLCKVLVAQYGPFVYSEIVNNTNPNAVCSFIGVCKNNGIKWQPKFIPYYVASNETCTKCKEIFSILESIFTKVTPDEFKVLLETVVCNQLPSEFKATCKLLVDGYTTQIYQLILSLLDGERICTSMHFCTTQVLQPNQPATSWNCQTCVDVVAVLKKDLVNVSESDLANFAKVAACGKLSVIIRGVCNEYVDSLTPTFYNDIHSSLTPQQICSKDSLCSLPRRRPVVKPMGVPLKCDICRLTIGELITLLSSPEYIRSAKQFIKTEICSHMKSWNSKCSYVVDNYSDVMIKLVKDHVNSDMFCDMIGACGLKFPIANGRNIKGVECEGCKLVVGQFKKFISNPSRQTMIRDYIKTRICPMFKSHASECQQSVDEFFNIVLNIIIAQLDTNRICHMFTMCSTTLKSNDDCAICELVMTEFVNLVTSNHTEQSVSTFITTEICPHLGELENECNTVVRTYLPFIFSLARSNLNAKLLCQGIHLCSVITKEKMIQLAEYKLSNTSKCDTCQIIVKELNTILTNPTVQVDVENFLKKFVCSYFGANEQKCINDINQYYSFVVNIIVEFLNPQLCVEFKLCQAFQEIDCPICKDFYDYLKTITPGTRDTTIGFGLSQLCRRRHNRERCLYLIEGYYYNILSSMKVAKNASEFCKMSHICSALKGKNLGTKSCSWGPGFWCLSIKHAMACGPGAVKHCEMSVWSKIPVL